MPRYVVERTFPGGLDIPLTDEGVTACQKVVGTNAEAGVTWIHSYVSEDRTKTYCVYDAPDPEAIRRTAAKNMLPVDRIVKVSVLDPYSIVEQNRRWASPTVWRSCGERPRAPRTAARGRAPSPPNGAGIGPPDPGRHRPLSADRRPS
jgi:Protein of unknown function (DUF4242)